MKIKEGAYYRTRVGDVVGPMKQSKVALDCWAGNCFIWHEGGHFNRSGAAHGLDLISEVYVSDMPPENAPASPSDDVVITMNFSELARKGSDWNSGTVRFYADYKLITAYYNVHLTGSESKAPQDTPPDVPLPDIITDQPCKTLRDEFAMAALTGFCSQQVRLEPNVFAKFSYDCADAMMEARKK